MTNIQRGGSVALITGASRVPDAAEIYCTEPAGESAA